MLSAADPRFDEPFGFTDVEVRKLLDDYGMSSHFAEIKEWYDAALHENGREDILAYGIAFCKKRCKVVCEKL